jgi:hypothetical protein
MADAKFISLGSDPKRVEFKGSKTIEDDFLYEFFKSYSADRYDDAFIKALTLGAYALKEERIAAFLGRAESELDGQLEQLKILFKVRTLKEKATTKGVAAEEDIADVLQDFVDLRGWEDSIVLTGEKVGVLPARKVGDVVVALSGSLTKIVLESKWDKSVTLGDPVSVQTLFTTSVNPEKSAFGQNLTALINREAEVAIIVLDKSNVHGSIFGATEGILFQPEIPGFVALVDREANDWSNLKVAYAIARSIAFLSSGSQYAPDRMMLLIKRLIRDLNLVLEIESELTKIEKASDTISTSTAGIRTRLSHVIKSARRCEELLTKSLDGAPIAETEWKSFFDESI